MKKRRRSRDGMRMRIDDKSRVKSIPKMKLPIRKELSETDKEFLDRLKVFMSGDKERPEERPGDEERYQKIIIQMASDYIQNLPNFYSVHPAISKMNDFVVVYDILERVDLLIKSDFPDKIYSETIDNLLLYCIGHIDMERANLSLIRDPNSLKKLKRIQKHYFLTRRPSPPRRIDDDDEFV
jgi:hypothetical protein